MNQLHKNRLLKLATFLRKVPRKHFNLNIITTMSYTSNIKIEEQTKELHKIGKTCKTLDCKTAACAIGWCPNVFPKSFRWNHYGEVELKTTGIIDFSAVEEFFGLDRYQSDYLFHPEYYRRGHRGPISVANRIEDFANKGFISGRVRYYD